MYQALYRKYRPNSLNEVVGQKVIIKTLKNSILNNKITHAYLFTGPRGTGKTSIAKIFAKIVNCENLNDIEPCNKCVSCTQTTNKQNTDIIEIDAASNNGVDEIRELRDKVNLVPSFGKYKVYIIDEVHMLTTSAFNALLKTLEEPPSHVIFILATTEPHKIPMTILSRCQRFDFQKIGVSDIVDRLRFVCENEKILIEDEALNLIAKLSDGGMRDSLSLLDQLTSYTSEKITVLDVNEVSGIITNEEIFEFIKVLLNESLNKSFDIIEQMNNNGKNLNKIIEEIIEFLKNCLIFYNDSNIFLSDDLKQMYSFVCDKITDNKIYKIIDILLEQLNNSNNSSNIKLLFELSIIKIQKELLNISKKKEIIVKDDKIEEKKEVTNKKNESKSELKEKLSEIKKIRINNSLANFDKKDLIEFKNQINSIKDLISDPTYSSCVSLILDGEIKVKGKENLIFVYKNENLEECFNLMLVSIEKILKKQLNVDYKPIAISQSEWEIIKNEYNQNLKLNKQTYVYTKEPYSLNEIFKKEENIVKKNENKIEKIFENIIEYN